MSRLSDVLGQEAAVRMLRDAIAADRLHHALLFAGPRGIGKRTLADALAAFLFCAEPSGGDACGRCESCLRVAARTHPDLHFIEPGGGESESSKRKTKTISIEQMREVPALLARRPQLAERRIAIVDDAESMTMPAQNALLKTLEEPPGNGLLMLVTDNPAALTVTVRSRCQRISLRPLSRDAVVAFLTEREGLAADEARVLAEHAEGSLGRALSADPTALDGAKRALRRLLERVRSEGYLAVPTGAREVLEIDESLGGGAFGALPLLAGELRADLRRAVELTPPEKTASLRGDLRALEAVTRAIDDLKHNANKALALERMLERISVS